MLYYDLHVKRPVLYVVPLIFKSLDELQKYVLVKDVRSLYLEDHTAKKYHNTVSLFVKCHIVQTYQYDNRKLLDTLRRGIRLLLAVLWNRLSWNNQTTVLVGCATTLYFLVCVKISEGSCLSHEPEQTIFMYTCSQNKWLAFSLL